MQSALIVDSSAISGIIFSSQRTEYSDALNGVFPQYEIVVPSLFLYEMTNVILMQFYRQKLLEKDLNRLLAVVKNIPNRIVNMPSMEMIAKTAQNHLLTGYDATYLALALQERRPLATQDKALKKAAQAEKLFYNPHP